MFEEVGANVRGALAFCAALAWNDAFRYLIFEGLVESQMLARKLFYAVFVTALASLASAVVARRGASSSNRQSFGVSTKSI